MNHHLKPTFVISTQSKAILFLTIICLIMSHAGQAADPTYGQLESRLIAEGFDSVRVSTLFQDERVRFIPALVELNLVSKEFPDYYRGFLAESQVEDGAQFLSEWRQQIETGLGRTKVPPAAVVAILKVESDLGRKSGRYPIFNTLASITLLKDSLHWVAQFDTSGGADLERLEKRAVRRSQWAYNELVQYLKLCDRENWDPLEVKGSWAGAIGWAQFIPSSYLRCARDGDGDGRVDPYALQDAVASIAAYLDEAGWLPSAASHRRALMLYNPSSAYVDCILEYARKLSQKMGSNTGNSSGESFNN